MKICFITTWPPKQCGIATYTNFLCKEILENENIVIDIITEKENLPYKSKRVKVHPVFDRKKDYTNDIIEKLEEIKPDVIHIQHEFSIFGFDSRLTNVLKNIRTKKVITLHTIFPKVQDKNSKYAKSFNKDLGRYCDKIIVHQKSNKSILLKQGLSKNDVFVIIHGTELIPRISKEKARKKIGFPQNKKIVLFMGFIRRSKIVMGFIDSLPLILNNPNTYFYVVGSELQLRRQDRPYLKHIKNKIKEFGINKKVIFVNKFVPEKDVPLYLNSADVLVFPYEGMLGGASGIAQLAIGAGKPIVVSKIPRFKIIIENISKDIAVTPSNTGEWSEVINRMLKDKKFRDFIIKKTKEFAEKSSWKNIAKQHLDLYKSL